MNNYPPLPKGDHTSTSVWDVNNVAVTYYTADQMRAYVDADRKMRNEDGWDNFAALQLINNYLIGEGLLVINEDGDAMAAARNVVASIEGIRKMREQAQPVAWMHSKTGKLANSPYDISLADGDETAIPLYEAPPLREAEIQDLRDRAVGMLEKSFPAPQAQPAPEPERKPPEWHDAPTEPGLWVSSFSNEAKQVTAGDVAYFAKFNVVSGRRWYGPIPQESAP